MENILIILCDQLTTDVLSTYSGEVNTKNIDALAQAGTVYENCYCQAPLCTPSRASLFTGLYPHNHGCVSNVMRVDYPTVGGPLTEEGITNEDVTLQKVLHDNGYNTAYYGKWHLSGERLSCYDEVYEEHYEYVHDMKDKFDETANDADINKMNWYGWQIPIDISPQVTQSAKNLPTSFRPNTSEFISKIGRSKLDVKDCFDYKVMEKCLGFIERQNEDNPFFLTCSINMPHDPNVVPNPYYDMYKNPTVPKNQFCESIYRNDISYQIVDGAGEEYVKEFLRIYYGMVQFVDDIVGELINSLKQNGLYENTTVVFVADHGDMVGRHGMVWKSTQAFYNSVAKVPLIISGSKIKKQRVSTPAQLVDIMPTILSMCNIDLDGLDGVDLFADRTEEDNLAISQRLDWNEGHTRTKHTNDNNYSFMAYDGRYKYCIHKKDNAVTELLYDHESDYNEDNNIADSNQKVKEQLKEKLKSKLLKSGYILN